MLKTLIENKNRNVERPFWLMILLDGIGMASLLFPAFGEITDLAWGPISAFLIYRMFNDRKAFPASIIQLAEEMLPLTDLLPTFTLTWLYLNWTKKKARKSKTK